MLPYYVNLEYVINGLGHAGSNYLANMECWFQNNKGKLTPSEWNQLIQTAFRRYDVYWHTSDDAMFCQNMRFIDTIYKEYNAILAENIDENEGDYDTYWDYDRWRTVRVKQTK